MSAEEIEMAILVPLLVLSLIAYAIVAAGLFAVAGAIGDTGGKK